MARSAITVYAVTETPSAPPAETNGDAANGHHVANSGGVWLTVRNADVSNPHTLSVGFPAYYGRTVTPIPHVIPASATRDVRIGDPRVHGTRTPIDVDSSQLKIIARKLA